MILFRRDQSNEDEYDAAKEIFGDRCTRFRTQISPNSKVFGRYSVLPYYKDLEEELQRNGSKLIPAA